MLDLDLDIDRGVFYFLKLSKVETLFRTYYLYSIKYYYIFVY